MALSWFCHGCLGDQEGEVPRDFSLCSACRDKVKEKVVQEMQDIPPDFLKILNDNQRDLLA